MRVRASSLRGGAVAGQTFRPAQGFILYLKMSPRTSYAQTRNMTWRHTLLQLGYGTLWKLHMITCAIRYIARPLDGRDCMTLRLSIESFVGAALLPSGRPKEIGISLDRPPASRTPSYRPYSGHLKGTRGPHRLYSCRRFEDVSTTQSFRMDP